MRAREDVLKQTKERKKKKRGREKNFLCEGDERGVLLYGGARGADSRKRTSETALSLTGQAAEGHAGPPP